MKGKRFFLLMGSVCLVLLLGACTASEETSEDSSTKDTIVIGSADECDVFFPAHSELVVGSEDSTVVNNIFEGPIRLMPDGSLKPLLAESWDISEDGREYTLHIRKGVTFQNGNPMTAEDVAFSLETSAPTYNGKAQLINYDYAEATDENTVVIHLTSAYAPFIKGLTGRAAYVFEKALYEEIGEDEYNKNPVGTGPYVLESRVAGSSLTLKSYENYWGGAPAVSNIVWKVISDANARMIALENGEIDVLQNADFAAVSKLPEGSGIASTYEDAPFMAFLEINAAKGPGTDINFRRALQCGINKQDLIIALWEGLAKPLDMFSGYNFTGRPDEGTYKTIDYDVEKAKEYLAASSYDGEEFVITTVSSTKNEEAAQIIQGQLIELGINCSVNAVDSASYFALVRDGIGNYGGAIRATGVSVYDTDGMRRIFHSSSYTPDNRYDPGWSSEQLDGLLDQARVEVDPEIRKQLYGQAADIITDEAFCVFLYVELSTIAYNENINNVYSARSLWFNDWNWK